MIPVFPSMLPNQVTAENTKPAQKAVSFSPEQENNEGGLPDSFAQVFAALLAGTESTPVPAPNMGLASKPSVDVPSAMQNAGTDVEQSPQLTSLGQQVTASTQLPIPDAAHTIGESLPENEAQTTQTPELKMVTTINSLLQMPEHRENPDPGAGLIARSVTPVALADAEALAEGIDGEPGQVLGSRAKPAAEMASADMQQTPNTGGTVPETQGPHVAIFSPETTDSVAEPLAALATREPQLLARIQRPVATSTEPPTHPGNILSSDLHATEPVTAVMPGPKETPAMITASVPGATLLQQPTDFPAAEQTISAQAGSLTAAGPTSHNPVNAPLASPEPPKIQQQLPLHRQLLGPIATLATGPHGERTLSINVAPEALGPITLKAYLGTEGIRMDLSAPTEAAREALRAMLPELRKELASTGGGQISLSTGTHPDSAMASGNPRGEHAGGGSAEPRSLPAPSPQAGPGSAAPPIEHPAGPAPQSTTSRLDVMA